jgi:hypothetical protein
MTALRSETEAALRGFLAGKTSPQEFEAWVVSACDDSPSDEEQSGLWELRLLLVEHGEGMRPLGDAKAKAAELLAAG